MIRNNVSQKMSFQHSVTDGFECIRVSILVLATLELTRISLALQRTTTWLEQEFFRMFLLLRLCLCSHYLWIASTRTNLSSSSKIDHEITVSASSCPPVKPSPKLWRRPTPDLPHFINHFSSSLLSLGNNDMSDALLTSYQYALKTDPLRTQVATGAALAVAGDAIAQRASGSKKYDSKRAVSFASFDACWRAVQHFSYPPMIALCQGNVLGALLPNDHGIAAALEQALVSQVIFIPLLYYPFFYAITGFVQGLTVVETVDRAKVSFWPLMRRNWLFWIPVQFCVFVAVPENAQISVLIAAGLALDRHFVRDGGSGNDSCGCERPFPSAADDDDDDDGGRRCFGFPARKRDATELSISNHCCGRIIGPSSIG